VCCQLAKKDAEGALCRGWDNSVAKQSGSVHPIGKPINISTQFIFTLGKGSGRLDCLLLLCWVIGPSGFWPSVKRFSALNELDPALSWSWAGAFCVVCFAARANNLIAVLALSTFVCEYNPPPMANICLGSWSILVFWSFLIAV
jgi:hypothetical protein